MSKKKSKLAAGTVAQIRTGVRMPEFESLDIGGWTGMVLEVQGKGAQQKVILEWDAATSQRIPADYQSHCEQQGLFAGMACVPAQCLEGDESVE